MRSLLASTIFLLLFAFACGSPAAPNPAADTVRVTGTVQFFTVEGGFWAVRADDGVTYDPINLPAGFQRENLRVSMVVKVRTDMAGIHMVGPIVEIIAIQRL